MKSDLDVSALAVAVIAQAVHDATRCTGRLHREAVEFLGDPNACGVWVDLAGVRHVWFQTVIVERMAVVQRRAA